MGRPVPTPGPALLPSISPPSGSPGKGEYMTASTRCWIAIVLLASVLSGCASMPKKPENIAPGDYGSTKEYISRLIEREMKKNDVTGLSIALVDDQRIIWAAGFGFADEANNIPATPETIYRAGSI